MVDGVGVEPTMPELQSGVLPFYDPSRRKMVGRDGFEPPTFRVSAEGSDQLSYLPMEGEAGIEPALLRFCRPHPVPISRTRPLVAETGIGPIPSVSETEALPLCNSAMRNGKHK